MSTSVVTGVSGTFAFTASDPWEEIGGSATGGMTGQITRYELTVEQEAIEHTALAIATSGRHLLGKAYYRGRATATCHFEGAYPSGRIFAGGIIVNSGAATTNYQDLTPGTGAAAATGKVTLLLTLDTVPTTDQTITMTGAVFNIRIGVNKQSGLNTISADVIGEVTGSA
jgi:hypothetical protein